MRWYSLDRIDATGCDYNFIFSGRGPGKSTAMVNHLIDSYFNTQSQFGNHSQFVRIARYDWAVSRTMMTGWFNEINKQHLREYGKGVTYKGGEWRLFDLKQTADALPKAEDELPYQTMGYLLPLNAQDDYKSGVDYSNVTNVVFEEFVQLRERDYVDSETELFLSALSTIVRNRSGVRCWFIGNTLTKYNPYFELFGIDMDRLGMQPGDLRTFRVSGYDGKGATIALEYAEMAQDSVDELSPLMRIEGNVTATSGVFAQTPDVERYKQRTQNLLPADLVDPLPWPGAYLGKGKFTRVRMTRFPVSDDMRLLVFSSWEPPLSDLQHDTFLNLSGDPNPTYQTPLDTRAQPLHVVSPLSALADSRVMRMLQVADARCIHAYETDEMRYKWRCFVDEIGYERGQQ